MMISCDLRLVYLYILENVNAFYPLTRGLSDWANVLEKNYTAQRMYCPGCVLSLQLGDMKVRALGLVWDELFVTWCDMTKK